MFYARKKLAKLVAWSQDYLNSVMRKSPPTPKPILDPGVLVIAIAIPPSKDRQLLSWTVSLCLVKGWIVPKSPAMDAQRLRARPLLLAPLRSPAGSLRVFVQRI